MELFQLIAEANGMTFEIGNFETKEEAREAVRLDKSSKNGIWCTTGRVVYLFDEEEI